MFLQRHKQEFKKLISLAVPVSISQLGHILVTLTDTAMVGLVGTTEQASVALANTIFVLILVFSIGFSFGLTPLVAYAKGSNNTQEIRSWLYNGLLGNILLSVVLCILLFGISPLIQNLGQPLDVVEKATPFLNILILSLIPLGIFSAIKQFAEGLSFTKPAMFISISGNIINIILNYILIFGKAGFEPMGYIGSAYATLIARILMALGIVVWLAQNKECKSLLKKSALSLINIKQQIKLYNLSIPTGLQFFFEVGAFSVATIFAGWLGTNAMAAHQIALVTASASYMVASGIGAAATILTGQSLGANDYTGVKKIARSALLASSAFMTCMAFFYLLFNHSITAIFSKNTEVLSISSNLIIIAAFFQLADGIQVVCLGALRGIKDVKMPTVITFISYWAVTLGACYLLGIYFHLGINGIWYGFVTGLLLVASLLFIRLEYLLRKLPSI